MQGLGGGEGQPKMPRTTSAVVAAGTPGRGAGPMATRGTFSEDVLGVPARVSPHPLAFEKKIISLPSRRRRRSMMSCDEGVQF